MKARAWLLPLALLAVPLASGTYGAGSQIEVDLPVALEGRVDTWLPGGTASFLGASPGAPVGVRLVAADAALTYRTFTRGCDGLSLPGATCPEGQYSFSDETFRVSDLSLTVVRASSAYKVLATADRAHVDGTDQGRVLVTSASATRLATNAEGMHLSPGDAAWTSDEDSDVIGEPVYSAEAYSAQLSASAAIVRATGSFEAFLQGVPATVEGTDADGSPFQRTFETHARGDSFSILLVDASGGDLYATSTSPLLAYAPADQRPVSDVHTRANFANAEGTIAYTDKSDRTLEGEDVSLAGPLSLTLTKIATGGAPRATYTIVDGLQLAAIADPARDDAIPPAALAAASAAGAGGAGALIALAYFWPRLKLWGTLLLLPMYTRIERAAVLDHEKRDELYELIRSTPGIHAHEIGEKARIGWGTTVYHLKLLENHGLIVSKKSGRYKRFFVNTGEYTKKKDVYGALRNETAKSVAQYIVDHPGTTQKEMCAALGIQPSLASWHVEKLEGVELVKRVKDGRMVRYFAGPAWADLNVRVHPIPGAADLPAET